MIPQFKWNVYLFVLFKWSHFGSALAWRSMAFIELHGPIALQLLRDDIRRIPLC
jgi:hypothetical protein